MAKTGFTGFQKGNSDKDIFHAPQIHHEYRILGVARTDHFWGVKIRWSTRLSQSVDSITSEDRLNH